jgi:hypothetical protein
MTAPTIRSATKPHPSFSSKCHFYKMFIQKNISTHLTNSLLEQVPHSPSSKGRKEIVHTGVSNDSLSIPICGIITEWFLSGK